MTAHDKELSPLQKAAIAVKTLRARCDALEHAAHEPIAIVGIGCRFPAGATGPEAFWQALREGRDGSVEVPGERWKVDDFYDPKPGVAGKSYTRKACFIEAVDLFDPLFFRISPREAVGIDPQQRLLLETVWEALEDAAIPPPDLVGSRTGVFLGISTNDYSALLSRSAHGSNSNASAGAGNAASVASGRISYTFGFQGPCMAIDTACSSSLVAAHQAVRALRGRECELAVVAGVNLMLSPEITVNFSQGRMLSADGHCKTFDESADGYARGEGCGVLVLKRLSDAVAAGNRVIALIRGSAVNQDGRSAGLTAPNGLAQEAVIRQALENARLTPEQVDYIEAHGTGTALGDPIEMHALRAVFGARQRPLYVSSVKTNIGHTEAAAGVAGLIKAALMIRHQALTPTLHFQRLNPHIDLAGADIRVSTRCEAMPVGVLGVSSFGFSGTNAHLVLSAPEATEAAAEKSQATHEGKPRLLLTARSEEALRALIARYKALLAEPGVNFRDVCHTAAVGRARFPWWIMVDHPAELDTAQPAKSPCPAVTSPGGKIIALPTYPFERQRYWAEVDAAAPAGNPAHAPLPQRAPGEHPLLGQHLRLPGSSEQRWQALVSSKTAGLEFLDEHRVNGRALMPATGFIEMALAANPGCDLVDLRIVSPLWLENAAGRLVQTIRAPGDKPGDKSGGESGAESGIESDEQAGGNFRIVSMAGDASDAASGKFETHLVGRAEAVHKGAFPSAIPDIPPFADEGTPLAPAQLYAAMEALGVTHGPTFRLLADVWRSDGLARGRLLEAPSATENSWAALHPAVLDAALQLAAAAVAESSGEQLLPTRLGRIGLLHKPLPPLSARCRTTPEGSGVRADILIEDARGVALYIADLRFASPHASGMAAEARAGMYQLTWQTQTLLDKLLPPHFFPAVPALVATLAEESRHLAAEHGMAAYVQAGDELEHIATAFVIQALDTLGLNFQPGAQFTFGPLAENLGIVEQHHRLLSRMLGMLETDGILQKRGQRWQVAQTPSGSLAIDAAIDTAIEALRARFPQMSGEIGVLHRCGAALAEVLTGRSNPLHLLFPANEEGAGVFYATSAYARTVNGVLRTAAQNLAASLPPGRVLRVLEVGAGTGGATQAILEGLSGLDYHYTFTDLSPAFLGEALKKFPDAGITPRRLDIEREPEAQGFTPAAFDLVIAANVLHATRDIRASLAHVHDLLADGGLLLLVESTAPRRWVDIVFGLTGGWWQFEDSALRPNHPLLSHRQWNEVLQAGGFETAGESDDGNASEVIVARRTAMAMAREAHEENTGWYVGGNDAFGLRAALEASGQACVSQNEAAHWIINVGPVSADALAQATLLRALVELAQVALARYNPPTLTLLASEDLGHAGLPGFVRSLAIEQRVLRPRLLLDPPGTVPLLDELLQGKEPEVRWTAGKREVRRLAALTAPVPASLQPGGAWLITGGYGGLGLEIARWLAERGATRIVLLGRHKPASLPAMPEGVRIDTREGNAADVGLLANILADIPDLQGVVHAAGALSDAPVVTQDERSIANVLQPKIGGALALDRVLQGKALRHFVLFSSVAGIVGTANQVNHAFCSTFLDGLAHARRRRGLPGLSLDWGVWSKVGAAARQGFDQQAEQLGLGSITPETGLASFGKALGTSTPQLVLLPGVDWPRFTRHLGAFRSPLYETVVAEAAARAAAEAASETASVGTTPAQRAPLQLRHAGNQDMLAQLIAGLLNLPHNFERDLPLTELGLDSLVAVEIKSQVLNRLGVEISVRELIEGASLSDLAQKLGDTIGNTTPPSGNPMSAGAVHAGPSASDTLAQLVGGLLNLPGNFERDLPLTELGLDSLVAVEIKNQVLNRLGVELSVRELIEGASLNDLAQRIADMAPTRAPALAPVHGTAAPQAARPENSAERLAKIVGGLLNLPHNFDRDLPLTELGLDSLVAVEIKNQVHNGLGIELSVRELIEGASLNDLARQLAQREEKAAPQSQSQTQALTPAVASAPAVAIRPDLANRYQPFPLTDMQQAYLVGRRSDLVLGGVNCYLYTEFDTHLVDIARLEQAWNILVRRHDVLRLVIQADGLQRILREVPEYRFVVRDLRGQSAAQVENELARLRAGLARRIAEPDSWPLFDISVTRFGDLSRLHLGFDLIALDAASIFALRQELGLLYDDLTLQLPPIRLSFRDYVMHLKAATSTPEWQQSEQYWKARAANLPDAPDLPLATTATQNDAPVFRRYSTRRDPTPMAALKQQARSRGLTLTSVLATVYADMLALWSRSPQFCLTVTLFNRPPLHPDMTVLMGDFTSTLLLEVDASAAAFAERARKLMHRLASDLDHAEVNGIQVLREVARQTGTGLRTIPVVFTSTLGFRPSSSSSSSSSSPSTTGQATSDSVLWDRLGTTVYNVSSTPQIWIDHQISEEDGCLFCHWDVLQGIFPPGLFDDMVEAYSRTLDGLIDGSGWENPLTAALPTSATRAPLQAVEAQECLHAAFLRQATQTPERLALIAHDASLDYGTLQLAAAHLAAYLATQLSTQPGGIDAARDRLVAVCFGKGWRQVVAVLAILQAGAAYLPVDPTLPEERRRLLIEQGEALPLDDESLLDEMLAAARAGKPAPTLPHMDDCSRLAYVIYTSGSTGTPKGVMIEHGAALTTVREINRRWQVGPEDRVLGLSALSFDLSVYDIFGPLSVGGALVLAEPAASRDPSRWASLLSEQGVTIWNSVPALMAMQVEYGLPADHALRLVMLSGDWVPLELVHKLQRAAPGSRLVALGGATEAGIWSNAHEIGALDPEWPSIPYGHALAGHRLHIVNSRGEPCPNWAIGQIEISGQGLARGYWRDPAKTAERFRIDPASGERRYLTGDMGRFRPYLGDDGLSPPIEFLGREDTQIKIQGYRIELGEIEAALAAHPQVAAAVATAYSTGTGAGDNASRTLHAFFVPKEREAPEACDPDWTALLATGRQAACDDAEMIDAATFDTVASVTTTHALSVIAHALRGMAPPDEPLDLPTLLDKAGVAERYRYWLKRVLPQIAGIPATSPSTSIAPIARLDRLGFGEADFALLEAVARQLPEILTERVHSSDIYLSRQTPEVYAKFFAGPNRLIARLLQHLAENAPSPLTPLSVLEVGGGLGTTLAALAPVLPGERIRYHFTDLSAYLVKRASETFGHLPWLTFGTLDFNRDVNHDSNLDSKLKPAPEQPRYQVIIATSALHAAADVRRTLAHLRRLLLPGGTLIFLEQTRFFPWYDLNMGLQAGFDSRSDFDLRPEHPLLARDAWLAALQDAGFTEASPLLVEGSLGDRLGIDVFMAHAPQQCDAAAACRIEEAGEWPDVLQAWLRQRLPAYMVPTGIDRINRIPLSSNGKVDRAQLQNLLRRRKSADEQGCKEGAGDEPQRHDMEREIAALVRELLPGIEVHAERSLFELGATSLTLVSLHRLIAERLGRNLPLQTMFEHPTVIRLAQGLAHAARATRTPGNTGAPMRDSTSTCHPCQTPQIGMREQPFVSFDSRPNLIMIPGVLGLPFYLRTLAGMLAPQIKLNSLQFPGLFDGRQPLDSIEAQAEYAVAHLRHLQPGGPYLLAGHSYGGYVAIEMARRLREAGESVPLLVLGDSVRTHSTLDAFQTDEVAYVAMTRALYALYASQLPQPYEAIRHLGPRGAYEATSLAIQQAGVSGASESGSLPFDRMLAVFKANFKALGAYRPDAIPGDLSVVRTEGGFPPEFHDYETGESLADPALGWTPLVQGKLEVYRIPGDHLSMQDETNLAEFAAILRRLVFEALRGRGKV